MSCVKDPRDHCNNNIILARGVFVLVFNHLILFSTSSDTLSHISLRETFRPNMTTQIIEYLTMALYEIIFQERESLCQLIDIVFCCT